MALVAGAGLGARVASWWLPATLLVLLLPMSELAVGLVNHLLTLLLPPGSCRSSTSRTASRPIAPRWSSCPRCSSRPQSAEALLERLEIHYLANPDPQLRFALLTDFADAPQETMPEDDAYLRDALERVQALNARYRGDGPDKFFLFHRRRLWNPAQGCWMGWERKRGKLAEFNRLLRGDRGTSYVGHRAAIRRASRRSASSSRSTPTPRCRARPPADSSGPSPTRSISRDSTRSAGAWSRDTASCSRG